MTTNPHPRARVTPVGFRDWTSARSLGGLGRLTAEWLERRRSWTPGYMAATPDNETGPHLIEALARVNRAGHITDSSQPGRTDDRCRQRAFVAGLANDETARYAEQLSVDSDLVVLRGYRGESAADSAGQVSIPVTACDGKPTTWLGRWDALEHDVLLREPLSADAREAITHATVLQVFDPVWGRDDVLWPWLHRLAEDLSDGTAAEWAIAEENGDA